MSESLQFVPIHGMPEIRQVSPDLSDYDQIHLLANPGAHYKSAQDFHSERLLVRANEHGFEITTGETAATLEENMALLRNLGRTTLIGVVGGDGTVSKVLHAAYELGLDNPFMVLNGGNAINQSRMHHYGRFLYKPDRILLYGRVGQIYPLLVSAEYPDGKPGREAVAFAYATAGMTGHVAAGVNSNVYRQAVEGGSKANRLIREAKITRDAKRNVVPFDIYEPDRPVRTRTELAYVSGKLMGKFLRCPSNLFEKECTVIEMADSRYRTIGRTAIGLALPFTNHRELREDQEHTVRLVTHDGSPIVFEEDGEDHEDPSGTTYTFRLANKPVNVVTERKVA